MPSKPKLPPRDVLAALKGLPGWLVVDGHHLEKRYAFPDFATGLAFVVALGEAAEQQDHHPDVHLSWGQVRLSVWSHDCDGLTQRDLDLAKSADGLYAQ